MLSFIRYSVFILYATILISSCTKEDIDTSDENFEISDWEQFLLQKMGPEETADILDPSRIRTRSTIEYIADMCDGSEYTGTVEEGGMQNFALLDYYSFYGYAGDHVVMSATRISCEMDPVMVLKAGLFSTSEDYEEAGVLITGDDDQTWGDCDYGVDEDGDGLLPCYSDPLISYILLNDGYYTCAVGDFASCGEGPFDYSLTFFNEAVPCPPTFIEIDGCYTGVINGDVNGESMMDLILETAENSMHHGHFVFLMAQMTFQWMSQGYISSVERGFIMVCAVQSSYPIIC